MRGRATPPYPGIYRVPPGNTPTWCDLNLACTQQVINRSVRESIRKVVCMFNSDQLTGFVHL